MSLNRKKSLTCALTSGAFALLSGLLPLSLQGQDLSPDNPFAQPSELSLYYPPFDAISNEDYEPAFEAGMAQHLVEIDAIVAQDAAPSFENTIVKLELAGQLLNRVSRVFFALSGAHTNDQIQALQQQIAPQLAAHDDAIVLNADLFARIQALFADRAELGLTPEAVRLIEQYHTDFVRAGAALSREEKSRLRKLTANSRACKPSSARTC
jgi:peptidyl-dipeptidase Dcp